MNEIPLETKIKLKDLELGSLLEITQAINANLSEQELYRIYNFILRANLNIKKIALYVKEEEGWICKVNFGTNNSFQSSMVASKDELIHLPKIKSENFNIEIPVIHNTRYLAYVFISEGQSVTGVNVKFIQALSNIIIVAIQNKKLVREQRKQELIKKEMEIAEKVQQLLLPKFLPYTDSLKIVAEYIPHHSIGGDYYDYQEAGDDHFFVCIADVSGKGIPAALLMSNFQALLRALIKQSLDLKYIISELNYQLRHSAFKEHFITFFIALYDKKSNTLSYVNAGHNPPVLFDESGEHHFLDKGCTILGFLDELPFLEIGDFQGIKAFDLFCYTDGVTELENDRKEEYGFDQFFDLVKVNRKENLNNINETLFQQMDTFRRGMAFNDDVTLVSCRFVSEK